MSSWWSFTDVSSGSMFTQWLVEAHNEADARKRFEEQSGCDPDHVSCACCGPNWLVRRATASEINEADRVVRL